jgi:nicotinamide-nucleotide amidase
MSSVAEVIDRLRAQRWKLATAESCTGGMVAAAITDVAGSSDIFDRGFVTYSNISKAEMLGVVPAIIATHGAVSSQVARAMAEGALLFSKAQVAVAVTGVAGPGGGSTEKPVGLVYFAVAATGISTAHYEMRFGPLSRSEIRSKARDFAVQIVLDQLKALP